MQTNCGDSDSEGISELSRSESVLRSTFTAVHPGISAHPPEKKKMMLRLTSPDRLRQHRIDALTAIDDEGSFSCVAGLACLVCSLYSM